MNNGRAREGMRGQVPPPQFQTFGKIMIERFNKKVWVYFDTLQSESEKWGTMAERKRNSPACHFIFPYSKNYCQENCPQTTLTKVRVNLLQAIPSQEYCLFVAGPGSSQYDTQGKDICLQEICKVGPIVPF